MAPARPKPVTLHSTWGATLLGFVLPVSQCPGIEAVWYNHPKS